MIINKISDKNNSKIIAKKYTEWIKEGVSPNNILVIAFNATSKKDVISDILKSTEINNLSDFKINTFNGLIYNSVIDNWGILEPKISNTNTRINPNLSGLEVSQYLLKEIIKEDEVKGYNSKKSLLHQIFRRYSLITNNNLTPDEIRKKSKILGESFGEDATKIIQKFKAKTIEYRTFDNIRQAQIFTHIYKNTDYFKNINYLIAEDCDELTPLFYDFLKTIAPQLKDKLILFDKDGGTRRGYLCAEPKSQYILKEIFKEDFIDETQENENINKLTKNIINGEKNKLDNIKLFSLSKRVDMAEYAVEQINNLIKNGVMKDFNIILKPRISRIINIVCTSQDNTATILFRISAALL